MFVLLFFLSPLPLVLSTTRSVHCDDPSIRNNHIFNSICVSNSVGSLSQATSFEPGPCSVECAQFKCNLLSLGCAAEYQSVHQHINANCADPASRNYDCAAHNGLSQEECRKGLNTYKYWPEPESSFSTWTNIESDWWKSQLEICRSDSALDVPRALGVDFGYMQALLDIATELQDPCGEHCRDGLCSLAMVGCDVSQVIVYLQNRYGCNPAHECLQFVAPPPTPASCSAVNCPPLQNCPPPDRPYMQPRIVGGQDDISRCCPTVCDDPCAADPCRSSEPSAATCAAMGNDKAPDWILAREPWNACCQQCVNPCPPCQTIASCQAPLVLEQQEGQCCPSCVSPCISVTCAAPPTSCPDGEVLYHPCADLNHPECTQENCCAKCVASASKSVLDEPAAIAGIVIGSLLCLCCFVCLIIACFTGVWKVTSRPQEGRKAPPSRQNTTRRSRAGSRGGTEMGRVRRSRAGTRDFETMSSEKSRW
jgi:hypothetical protein